MMDIFEFEERAAIIEFDGGRTRFAAETIAATFQYEERWRFMNEINKRNSQQASNPCQASTGNTANDLSGMQPCKAKQEGPMSFGNLQTGRSASDVPSLRMGYGRVL